MRKAVILLIYLTKNILASIVDYPGLICKRPEGLIHFRRIDPEYPCHIECIAGALEYCSDKKVLFCDDDRTKCECKETSKICEKSVGHAFTYINNKCHCKSMDANYRNELISYIIQQNKIDKYRYA